MKCTIGCEKINFHEKNNPLLRCEPYAQLTITASANDGEGHWSTLYDLMKPNFPGVYLILSESGEIVYIGESKEIEERLCCYIEAKYRIRYCDNLGLREYIEKRIEPSNLGSVKIEIYQTKNHMLVEAAMLAFHYVSTGALPRFNREKKFSKWDRKCPVTLEILTSLLKLS